MRVFITLLLCLSFSFSSSENVALMNDVKSVIQKEEFIALAINNYIKQTARIPKKSDNTLDWDKLLIDGYLGKNFNKYNPLTKKDISVKFDSSNNCYIQGVITSLSEYKQDYGYMYHFYINKIFRINTLSPQNTTKEELLKGSLVVYQDIQKQIVSLINQGEYVRLNTQKCPTGNHYYELKNNKLTFKRCMGDYSLEVYQTPPIYLEDWNDLQFVKAKVGDIAYAKKNGQWFAYFFQGDLENENKASWRPVDAGSVLTSQDPSMSIEDRVIAYIPDTKDLVLRKYGGCMLANGDIFCWGNNSYKKAGVHSSGQIDTSLSPDYVNTPVMLKVQIDNTEQNTKRWYNNPYRIKFEKMSMNNTNVCGISPIFDYFQSGVYKKFGGDLYCNGSLHSDYFDDLGNIGATTTSILKKHKFFATGKENELNDSSEIYLKDVVMVDGTIAVLSDAGIIYTIGSNEKGALGINSIDESFSTNTPMSINQTNQRFKKVFALRDIKGFGAIDEFSYLWIWGQRTGNNIIYQPEQVSFVRFDAERVFVNSKDFVLQGLDKKFYRTYDKSSLKALAFIPNSAISVSIYDRGISEYYLYVSEDMQVFGTEGLITCKQSNQTNCISADKNLFDKAFNVLNNKTNTINNKDYANFSNVSIFESSMLLSSSAHSFGPDGIYLEDFNTRNFSGWSRTGTGGYDYLGRFNRNNISPNGSEQVSKTFDFGLANANKNITIEFDWYVYSIALPNTPVNAYINGTLVISDSFYTLIGGEVQVGYSYDTKLDAQGRVKIGFGANNLGITTLNYFGVDNIKITRTQSADVVTDSKLYVCAMTGFGSGSQMYCWGSVARALPILSTSVYDVNKISSINKLFITQNNDLSDSMSYDEFNDNGTLFLKYPLYIGGFDYEFYFK
ncbi:hypothetical protein [Arcobacter sp. FWKO B]|uniref:hypothetical protein n=1 Tax=Arcobacter sp. FWKO B TaxID=2593672 RepID=UPI0018A680E5|nr:hypothetical protein [Arcobacter sp. FWKO B]QOG11226.1 hypothetical protein FWKOB_00330 [Arcobacter sp. FWKO B]